MEDLCYGAQFGSHRLLLLHAVHSSISSQLLPPTNPRESLEGLFITLPSLLSLEIFLSPCESINTQNTNKNNLQTTVNFSLVARLS